MLRWCVDCARECPGVDSQGFCLLATPDERNPMPWRNGTVAVFPPDTNPAAAPVGALVARERLEYEEFLKRKVAAVPTLGVALAAGDIHPALKEHQKAIVRWAVAGGRRAIFASFGLGKSLMQLETLRLTLARAGGKGLIVLPLGVRQEFVRDARMIDVPVKFIRRASEIGDDVDIYLTNYETIRDGKLDPLLFTAVSLDEASVLRGLGGTKTFREFMKLLAGDDRSGVRTEGVPYRFVATATPSPNDYTELLAYSAYLGLMDVSQAKTRFFKRDTTHSDRLTLHAHKVREFWLWVASWAVVIGKPSDLGAQYSDEGYDLPPFKLIFHELAAANIDGRDRERDGQMRLMRDPAKGLSEAAREKRGSLAERVEETRKIIAADPDSHYLIWHDLEDERRAIQAAVPECKSVWGSQDMGEREERIIDFSEGKFRLFSTKPVLAGQGCNFQYHCHKAIFTGVGYKFNDFIQACHRIVRFQQQHECEIHIIHTEAEKNVLGVLLDKWEKHKTLVEQMSEIARQYGLNQVGMEQEMQRGMGVERTEATGSGWKLVNNDCVLETRAMKENSVHLVVTSIPFSTQYEYSPNYADFGHTDSNSHFWQQMDYLITELLRVLQPGRIAAIHVKDRIVPGGLTGLGFQTVYPFHNDCYHHFKDAGFAYLGMKTVVTDVVRENNQTYRLGWSEQCKDGSRMGVGMPEYLLLFRKPPSDNSNGYADIPVVKAKERYSRSRWQIDAHGFRRSNGNRLLTPEDLEGVPHETIFKLFRSFSLGEVYDYEQHVALGERLEERGSLPVTFMLLQPQSWSPEVWTEVARMRTLNGAQHAAGRELHICPMQFDLVDPVIEQLSQPGETVYDPFSGIGTVASRAVALGRRGLGVELCTAYHLDAVFYCKQAEAQQRQPTLFDLVETLETEERVAA